MNVHTSSEAVADLFDGIAFYEQQSPGLGRYFSECIRSDIRSLRTYAGIHRKILGYHRLLSEKFPYAIFYRIEGDNVTVWRVLDCRRNPKWIERQVRARYEDEA